MKEKKFYDKSFYQDQVSGSILSAAAVVPHILDLTKAKSVVDIGCGVGSWLSVFAKNGIEDYKGVDGDYVNEDQLVIGKEHFRKYDLKNPYKEDRKYDLCISLEVGEHLPYEVSETFVATLTGLSDVVMFSAAIPLQLGTHHINEQYPEFWANIFEKMGYKAADCIRPLIWNRDEVEYWYKQNILVFVKASCLADFPQLAASAQVTNKDYLTKIHPGIFTHKVFKRWMFNSYFTMLKLMGKKYKGV